jgi:cell cycle sensor histidine kinase DivJ
VAMHGGELNVQSRVGEGTTMAVALPLLYTPPVSREPAGNVAMLTPASRGMQVEQPYQVKKSA